MVREMSAAPDWMVRHMRTARSRCNPQECDAASAPAWKLEALSGNLPKGPEVGYFFHGSELYMQFRLVKQAEEAWHC